MKTRNLQLGFLALTGVAAILLTLPLTIHSATKNNSSQKGTPQNKNVDDLLEVYKQKRGATTKKTAVKSARTSKVKKPTASKKIQFHPGTASKATPSTTSKSTPTKKSASAK